MTDFYRSLKPTLNKLSRLNVWDSLFVIRQYCNNEFENIGLDKVHKESIENFNVYPIHVYIADFLISASLKYSQICKSEYSLRKVKERYKICTEIYKVYEKANKILKIHPAIGLKAHILSQRKMQHYQLYYERMYKYYYLFSSENLKEHVQNTLGFNVKDCFLLAVCLYLEFSKSFSLTRTNLIDSFEKAKNPWTQEEFHKLFEILSLNIKDVRYNKNFDCSNDDLMLFYNNAQHVMRPLLCDGDNIYCPIPIYILNSCIEGLQFHADLKNNTVLNNELAHNLENYIGEQLSYFSDEKIFKYKKEISYTKERKTSDWLIYDDENIIFLDCKLKKLTIDASKSLSIDNSIVDEIIDSHNLKNRKKIESLKEGLSPLMKDILSFGVDVGKILCCYYDWRNNMVKELPYNKDLRVFAVILTLEETYCNVFEIKECIDKIALAYLYEKRGHKLEDVITTKFISSSTFDMVIPKIKEKGLYKTFFEIELNIEKYGFNDWLKKGFNELVK